MSERLGHSGLEVIGDVAWGAHFCQFYQSPRDLLDVLVPYFAAGLENNEFCMWITSEPSGAVPQPVSATVSHRQVNLSPFEEALHGQALILLRT